jgi:hypothetical protein
MTNSHGETRNIRITILLAAVGTLACLALLVRETPYTFSIFMFLGQPCLLGAFLLFAWQVAKDLRGRGGFPR